MKLFQNFGELRIVELIITAAISGNAVNFKSFAALF